MNGRTGRGWLVPLTGVAFLVVLIVNFIVQGEPKSADDGALAVANWYRDNKDQAEIASFLGIAAGVLLIFFGAYLRRVFDAADPGRSMLPILVLIGLSIVAVGGAIDSTLLFAAAEAADDISAPQLQTIQAIWDNDFLTLALGVEVFLWAASLCVLRTGALPKWLGWVGIVLAIVGFTPVGFAAAIGAALWIVIVSILLALRERSGTVTPTTT
jgi:hypothetical protein